MDYRDELQKALRGFVKDSHVITIEAAKVQAVSESGETVDVETVGGFEIFGVALTAPATTNKIVVFPKVGSVVYIASIGGSDNQYFVVSCSEVNKVKGKIGQTLFEVDTEGVHLERNGEDLKGVLNAFYDKIKTLQILTTTGIATVAPVDVPLIDALKIRLNKILK
jgi:hypothetical protein